MPLNCANESVLVIQQGKTYPVDSARAGGNSRIFLAVHGLGIFSDTCEANKKLLY
jgi:hypothetical protein